MANPIKQKIILALVAGLWAAPTVAAESTALDVTQVPIEQLVQTEFIPASRIARQISDAPSAVSIVTAQDIRDYGYRTLSDVLKSMRGLYVTSTLIQDSLGGRGLGHPGDYAGRIMLMIDGYAVNDNVQNQVFIGDDGLIDVELIDRVEFIPGPGSTSYGNNAFLGVINVTTKRGRDIDGVQLGAGFGSENANQRMQRFSYGKHLDNGAELLLSASRYEDEGRSIVFPELSAVGLGDHDFRHMKETDNHRLFFKGSYEGWTLEFGNARYALYDDTFFDNGVPTEVGRRDSSTINDNGFISLNYDAELNERLKSSSHVYYGQYLFRSDYRDPTIDPGNPDLPYVQLNNGRWWGTDVKFVGTWFDNHTVLFGAELRNNYQQKLSDSSASDEPLIDTSARTLSLYAQDEYRLTNNFAITPGFRYDHDSRNGGAFSPRLAGVYQPWSSSTFKLSYGNAFRYRNPWEDTLVAIDPNRTTFKQEVVSTTELVWQQQFSSKSRLTTSLYHSHITNVVAEFHKEVTTDGQEIGLEHITDDGMRLNTSYIHQYVENNLGPHIANVPHWLAKLNIAKPLLQNQLTAGFEVQSIGPRYKFVNLSKAKSETLANLTLSSSHLIENANVSLSIRNLFNTYATDIAQPGYVSDLRLLPLPRRNLWLQLEYNFR
ncbi:iron complex outermembrane recepter protein [Novimethylophilus kurashikiensis]|uniref:Iron complex outermembrane recepter protein n=1 Tax=Novimethylophilus kurashikiensis TaxID=1825523 RepID=A0A2R5FBP2_9PROT|nr:TonB-dependent receptor [Novimethylophilus kurashikiensis]GBG15636.1 iron complex outermembrane recepter protein [Novimethylophilus kurashikiensis]